MASFVDSHEASADPTRQPPIKHLVAIRPGALGDTLLALPTLAWVRRHAPATKVTFVARRDVAELAHNADLADDFSAYDAPQWMALFADNTDNTAAPDTTHKLLSGSTVLAWLADDTGLVQRNLYRLGAREIVIARGKPAQEHPEHMALTLAHGIATLGLAAPVSPQTLVAAMPPLHATLSENTNAAAHWQALHLVGQRVVAFHAGSGGAAKRWPPDCFAQLMQQTAAQGFTPLLLGSPQDEPVTQAVIASSALPKLAVAQHLTLGELTAVLQRCAAYVGNDSGATHLAALAGTSTLALFGPSDPRYWSPLSSASSSVTILPSPIGAMSGITISAAWDALHKLLS